MLAETISGMKPFRAVHGNIDGPDIRALFPETLIFTCEGMKVLITHIGGYPGKYPANIRSLLISEKPGLFICGHSHILRIIYDKLHGLLHINPGAAGNQGFHQVKTAVRFELQAGEVKNAVIIELGKRSA
jgi:uncharacterized protein